VLWKKGGGGGGGLDWLLLLLDAFYCCFDTHFESVGLFYN